MDRVRLRPTLVLEMILMEVEHENGSKEQLVCTMWMGTVVPVHLSLFWIAEDADELVCERCVDTESQGRPREVCETSEM
jgi:hypothetical protein